LELKNNKKRERSDKLKQVEILTMRTSAAEYLEESTVGSCLAGS
jgi:hypothetical protein